jgi:RNA polymerase sigma-70 factor (ECF subfamily)
MLHSASDEDLVRGFLAGDEDCFTHIFERHHRNVYKLAAQILRNEADADDLVQDIFIQIFKKLYLFKFECRFPSWLYKVTWNHCLMKIRSQKRKPVVHLADLEPMSVENIVDDRPQTKDITYMTCGHELRHVLTDAVNSLPHNCRCIFVMRDVDGLSVKAISDHFAISESIFKNRLHRARTLMRKMVSTYLEEVTDEAA